MIKKIKGALRQIVLCCALTLSAFATDSDAPSVVALTESKKTDPLHLSFEKPAGWSIEWYDQSTQSIARIYRTEARGAEGIVISSTKLPDEYQSMTAKEVYAGDEFKKLAKMLNASIHLPDDSMKWDGVYLEYPLPPAVQITPYKINVRNWFTITENHLVQFQCYYVFNPSLTVEQQSIVHHKLDAAYLEILQSVKRTN